MDIVGTGSEVLVDFLLTRFMILIRNSQLADRDHIAGTYEAPEYGSDEQDAEAVHSEVLEGDELGVKPVRQKLLHIIYIDSKFRRTAWTVQ